MNPVINIVIDLDDTVFETEYQLERYIQDDLGHDFVWTNRLNPSIPILGPLLTKALAAGVFMVRAEFCRGFSGLMEFIEEIKAINPNVSFSYLTHRGFHPKAEELTKEQFDRLGLVLDGECIDFNIHPCKRTYLDNKFGKDNFYLFDDHPKWNGSPGEKVDNIFLMNKPWNQKETAYVRLNGWEDFKQKVIEIAQAA